MHRLSFVIVLVATAAHAAPDRNIVAIRAAAEAYQTWRRVDERPNIAPGLCRIPLPEDYGAPSHVRLSKAEASPHGRKLYYLWANNPRVYLDRERAIPTGFTIVKESFDAVAHAAATADAAAPADRAAAPTTPAGPAAAYRHSGPPAPIDWMITEAGERLTTGARQGLFVMTKVGDQPGSDAGWIYGTVAPDGTVTSAGRVEACMHCHAEAAHRERLFGLRAAPRS